LFVIISEKTLFSIIKENSNNDLPASAQRPYGDSTAVDFIYGGFGLAFIESTPYIAVRPLRCPPKNCYGFLPELFSSWHITLL